MQINSIDPYDMLLYGSSNIKNYAGTIDPGVVSQFITPVAQQYIQESVQRNHWYNSDIFYDQVRSYLVEKGPGVIHQDFIAPLYIPEQIRMANLTIQRWIMAEPTIRQSYVDGQISGYEHTYIDYEPGKIGEDHSDWRHVMNGIVYNDEVAVYVDNYSFDKPKLTIGEVSDILQTWSNARLLMDLGVQDITDPLADDGEDPTFTDKTVDE